MSRCGRFVEIFRMRLTRKWTTEHSSVTRILLRPILWRAVSGLTAEDQDQQQSVEGDDGEGDNPGYGRDPGAIGKLAHFAAVVRELDQRHNGKRKLKAEDHLAEDQEIGGLALARNTD